jgi:hypothetical protein
MASLVACGGQGAAPDPDRWVTPPLPDPTTSTPVPPPPDDAIIVTQDGLGDLDLGARETLSLSLTDVETWLGEPLSPKPQTDECVLATNEEFGIALVTDQYNGVMGFVLDHQDVVTSEGIRVGSTSDELIAAYGESLRQVDGATSVSGGPLIFVDDDDAPGAPPDSTSRHLAFDLDAEGTVTRLKSGYWPWMGFRDYCEAVSDSPEDFGWPLTDP